MRIDRFRFLLKRELDVFYIDKDIMIFKKPYRVWNAQTDETTTYKSVDELLEHKINGTSIRDMILKLDHPYTPEYNGRGSSKGIGNELQQWKGASGDGGSNKNLLPAQANTRIKSKSLDGALAEFKRNHLLSNREFAYEVDEDGYVHQYIRGGNSSVGISSGAKVRRGDRTMIIHNHPNGSAFSPADMLSTAADRRAKGIIASGKNYDYKFEKGTRFKAAEFTQAVRRAEKKGLPGKDINDAVDRFLRENQKKYGYKYTRTKN